MPIRLRYAIYSRCRQGGFRWQACEPLGWRFGASTISRGAHSECSRQSRCGEPVQKLWMDELHQGPVTLGDLIGADKLLWVYCRDCCHERDLNPANVPLPADTPVPDAGKRMKCSVCGSRKIS